MAWGLFGPLLARELGSGSPTPERTEKSAGRLDELMAGSWVVLHRAPALHPAKMIAFHPVRIPGQVLRIPLAACLPMEADFDGDQVAVFLPVTEAGQREAGEWFTFALSGRRDLENIKKPLKGEVLGLLFLFLGDPHASLS